MTDISRLHPLLQEALRTGNVPERDELERLLGSEIDVSSDEEDPPPALDPDQERFRARYHAMVDERIADWLDEHPDHGRYIPEAERERIEVYCNIHIQRQWAAHLRALSNPEDEVE